MQGIIEWYYKIVVEEQSSSLTEHKSTVLLDMFTSVIAKACRLSLLLDSLKLSLPGSSADSARKERRRTMAYRFPWPSRRHPTHQRLLVREIQHRYNDIEEQIKDLQSNTSDWALARVERFAGTTGKVLSYARTGLNDPSDVDEFTAVSRMVEKLEDMYIEIWVVIQLRRTENTP